MKYFVAKKRLGQNFLIDQNVLDRIINECQLSYDDIVLEIGPGKGALTRLIAPHVKKCYAVERDADLYKQLSVEFDGSNVEVFHEDFLKFDLNQIKETQKIKVIGNLPYNISTPIIDKIIDHRDRFNHLFMTVQLEFGQRLTAKLNTKDYSSLSCFTQFYTDSKLLFKIGNRSFRPIPKVTSCFMRLSMLDEPKHPCENEEKLFQLIRQAFTHRRKTIVNALGSICEKEQLIEALNNAEIDLKSRAENVSIEQYANLANQFNKNV